MGSPLGLTRPLRRLPPGLIGMIGLLVVIECLLASRAESLARRLTLTARFAAEESTRGALACKVIGLGDSAMKFGFDPAEFERGTGLRGYNLAVPGTPPPMSEALLRKAMAAGARPAVVVIEFVSLSGDPWVLVPEFAEVLDTAGTFTLARDLGDPGFFAAVSLARVLPSVRLRHTLRAKAGAKLLGRTGLDVGGGRRAARASQRHWEEGLGSERRRTTAPADERSDLFITSGVFDHPWPVVPAFERSLRRLVALAEAHRALVVWLVPPLAPYAQARRDALGFEEPHTRSLRAIQERMPGVVVLDARRAEIPVSDFSDSCHLNALGASRFSTMLATALGRSGVLRGGGVAATSPVWIALAPVGREIPTIAAGPAGGPTRLR